MFQKGPGEGYMAAKADCLKIDPSLVCKKIEGEYGVFRGDRCIGAARIARDAWGEALGTLETGLAPWQREN